MTLLTDLALAGAVLLVVAGVRHLARGDRTLRGHGLLPPWMIRVAVLADPLIGLAAITAWLAGDQTVTRYAWLAAATWHAALAAYLTVLLRERGRVPCGCLDTTTLVSPLKIAITVAFFAATAAASPLHPPPDLLTRLLHLPLAAFAALLTTVATKTAALTGTPRPRNR
ncbi:MauE/DoxX family redox-associated membrane protein [Sphaerisporangium aureirubrum]|uniref:MauE/DoxX family redox-associated membrane protein n=1 Tax=Sphaerisporangium aureirubrum TaxID=1544736 RepID=A0ABW1NVP0_9ACTN